ncbi:MAG: succinate dehydrogenase [Polyangiaceae bacterium]|nr:succinate dehydrogenase [Polyangiaceae bacterium]
MSTAATSPNRADATFLVSRLSSLLAVLPLGVWTVAHLWNNLAAFQGEAAWQHAVTEYKHPYAFFASTVLALLPLALHTVWGVQRILTTKPNNTKYTYFANLKYLLQRLSAIGILLFLLAHITLAFLKPRLTTHGQAEAFSALAHEMHHNFPTLAVYVLGILGVAYHLANGLHTFCMGWGVVSSRAALNRLNAVAAIVFVCLLAMGWGAIWALYVSGS